jgi:membrane protein implicated in regulation of membrane protease activity
VDKFIVKLFGINRLNFWGWVACGFLLLLVGASLVAAGAVSASEAAATGGSPLYAVVWLLAAIAIFLFGILTVLLQIYTSLLAEKLEKQQQDENRRREEDCPPWPDAQTTGGRSSGVTDRGY